MSRRSMRSHTTKLLNNAWETIGPKRWYKRYAGKLRRREGKRLIHNERGEA